MKWIADQSTVIVVVHFFTLLMATVTLVDSKFVLLDDLPLSLSSQRRSPWEMLDRLCPRLTLANGKVNYQRKNRVAKFSCRYGYQLVGQRSAICLRGQWDIPLPLCVGRNCDRLLAPRNGDVRELRRRVSLLVFSCKPGYSLYGSASVYCTGGTWNSTAPVCQPLVDTNFCNQTELSAPAAEAFCDFEHQDSCSWKQDGSDDFDWLRFQLATPSGHIGTGPSRDHTAGKDGQGHYMYIEASSPRKEGDTARLYSPVFPQACSIDACFSFWYHMYGRNTGTLRVFVKPDSVDAKEVSPSFNISGDQGDKWLRGLVTIPVFNEPFQIILEGIRGPGYSSDIAVDDMGVLFGSRCDATAIDDVNTTIGTWPASPGDVNVSTVVTSDAENGTDVVTIAPATPLPVTPSPATLSLQSSSTRMTSTVAVTAATTGFSTMGFPQIPYIPPRVTAADVGVATTTSSAAVEPTTGSFTATTVHPNELDPGLATEGTLGSKGLPPWIYMDLPTRKSKMDGGDNNAAVNRLDPMSAQAHTAGGAVSLPMAVGIAVVALAVVALVGVAAHVLRKRRQRRRQDGLTEDSDVRYLKDGEIQFEFFDAASCRIGD